MGIKKKKEFKQLDIEDIIARIDSFLDTQRLENDSKYFIHKVMTERAWESIRPDKDDSLNDFFDDDDFSEEDPDIDESIIETDDVDDVDSDLEEVDSDDSEADVDEEEVILNDDAAEDVDPLTVDGLMGEVVDENEEAEKLAEKKAAKKKTAAKKKVTKRVS